MQAVPATTQHRRERHREGEGFMPAQEDRPEREGDEDFHRDDERHARDGLRVERGEVEHLPNELVVPAPTSHGLGREKVARTARA
jgi:hypothetical protein